MNPHSQSEEGDVLVEVEGISKRFCRTLKRSLYYGVLDIGLELRGLSLAGRPLRKNEFWANEDISFRLRRGECLGLVGANGAGKTTLLKILNGLIKPDEGTVRLYGRVGGIIALGAGFNPVLTGRENIAIAGSVLGLTQREIRDKIDEIIDFSELHEFIDSPVRTYSSGMSVRLGFAVATALKPEILLLDEVLAVGDERFRHKCFNRIGEIQGDAAIIFVSHNADQISLVCDRVVVLERGRLRFDGSTADGLEVLRHLQQHGNREPHTESHIHPPVEDVRFSSALMDSGTDQFLEVTAEALLQEPIPAAALRVVLHNRQGIGFADCHSRREDWSPALPAGRSRIKMCLGPLHLRPDTYTISFHLNDSETIRELIWIRQHDAFIVEGEPIGGYAYNLPLVSREILVP